MRISGGSLRGRRVTVPGGILRPAMDRMRESVFAMLGDLEGRSFLDLFSGSLVIALEAASRGANPVEAVEMDPLKRKTILQNAAMSPVRIQCHFLAVELYVKRAKRAFDFIFCDPPFPYRYKWELALAIAASPLMGESSLLLFHRPREDPPPGDMEGLLLRETKEYGRSRVDFFIKAGKTLPQARRNGARPGDPEG